MKKIKCIFFFFITTSLFAQGSIDWVSLEEALAKQKEEPKSIIIDIYAPWCGPCKLMDERTYKNKDVIDYINAYFYAVKFNGEGNDIISYYSTLFTNPNYNPNRSGRNATHQFTKFLNVSVYPTLIFLSEKGELIFPISGYLAPQQIELYLKMVKKKLHYIFDTQEDFENYRKNFISNFKS